MSSAATCDAGRDTKVQERSFRKEGSGKKLQERSFRKEASGKKAF
jgi:hypothetical protein